MNNTFTSAELNALGYAVSVALVGFENDENDADDNVLVSLLESVQSKLEVI